MGAEDDALLDPDDDRRGDPVSGDPAEDAPGDDVPTGPGPTPGTSGTFGSLSDLESISLLTHDAHGAAMVALDDGRCTPVTYDLVGGQVIFTPHHATLRTGDHDRLIRLDLERYDQQTDCICQITVTGRATILEAGPATRPASGRWLLEPHHVVGTRRPR